MCLAPCYKGCTDERYAEESAAVQDFLATRGESKLVVLRGERDTASENLAFEDAAALHAQVQKAEAVRALAPELVQPMSKLSAVILQPPAGGPTAASVPEAEVSVFLFVNGRFRGPLAFSTVGMRIQNEQSGSSSLFAQPMALEPVPENRDQELLAQAKVPRTVLEARMEAVLAQLEKEVEAPTATMRQGHLALLKRWYYRPEVKREGEICFPNAEGRWPIKSLLRSVGRMAAKTLAPAKMQ